MAAQPTGTVTLVFTDIEGSTRLLQRLGQGALLRRARPAPAAVARGLRPPRRLRGELRGRLLLRRLRGGRGRRWPRRRRRRRRSPPRNGRTAGRFACGSGSTPVSRRPSRRSTSGSTCTWPRGSWPPATAGRCCSARRRATLVEAPAADLGEHTLSDFDEPVRLFQLGGRRVPAAPDGREHEPRPPATSFVGRDDELAEVLDAPALASPAVTLTGSRRDGQDAAGARGRVRVDRRLAERRVVRTARAGRPTRRSSSRRSPRRRRARRAARDLRSRRLLLVLDNLEQLARRRRRSSPTSSPRAPSVRVLATSRERLKLSIEQEYPVPTLPPADAAELFVQRARLRKPAFEPDELGARDRAAASTACRSRSSWPPPASRCSPRRRSWSGWAGAST